MKKNALVSVSSIQDIDNDKDDNIKVVTPGEFYKKENDYYVVYDETEISGMEGTTTTFKINLKDNKFSLIREGTTSTNMEFEKLREDMVLYNTPYGALELKINTKNVDIDLNDEGGNIIIDYDMSVAGQKSQNTLLKINIQTQ